ncbi:ABC transporter substrate-binding protein [Oceanobacillus sp. HCA-5259]|uniref:ABC transporter substrate-binding protein n=1 Tax=Oceanobacillus TaxID=182709 RepID=UPI001F11FBD0|nr:ABC transporter substrate-binding protein [Oceanobacillus alkalisoli]MCF3944049.1 ABC transporter substrate-binding protein [Oceanobacillus alkalisoli]
MNRKSMKGILLSLFIISISMILVACGSSSDETTQASDSENDSETQQENGEVTEITFWYAFGDAVGESNESLTEEFNETVGADEGIHVNAEFQGDYNDIYSKLQSGFVAGEVPNISVINSLGVLQFAKNDMLEPIGDFISNESLDDFYPGLLLNSYYDDVQYGLPYLRSTPLMYYNKTLFEELGIDENLETFDDVKAASEILNENGYTGMGFIPDQWHFDALMRQSGGGIMNEDMTEAIFASESTVELFEFLRENMEEENFDFYQSGDDQTTAIANQGLGIWLASTGSLANTLTIAEDAGFEIGTAFIPTKDDIRNVPTGGANIVMVAGQSEEEKEASAVFMNWLTAPDQAAKSHVNTGYLPTRQSLGEHPDVVAINEENPQYQTALDQLDHAGIEPNAPGYAEVVALVSNMITELLTTDVEIMPTLESYEDEANAVLEENR